MHGRKSRATELHHLPEAVRNSIFFQSGESLYARATSRATKNGVLCIISETSRLKMQKNRFP